MGDTLFATQSKSWLSCHPLLTQIKAGKSVLWSNQNYQNELGQQSPLGIDDIEQASARLIRFAPFIASAFPETKGSGGIIESPLVAIDKMQSVLASYYKTEQSGKLWLKCDSQLPISGSVKARGGIYEVLKHAETIALKAGLLSLEDDYAIFDSNEFRTLFSQHHIAVGSTGNLGLSIGIISAQLGFKVSVHMSADAKAWKKQLLREKGVNVIEYQDDYSKAVTQGRIDSQQTANSHFIDDENSEDLFLGYAVAALRLKQQLDEQQIIVDHEHPLFVYLPCGVGGAPGGIAFGLKQVFAGNVHCFFAEPTTAPCMLLGMYTQLHERVCVQDIGLDGITCADGLAVGRPSAFVGKTMNNLLSGIYTLDDKQMYQMLALIKDTENISLEPSALAGVIGMHKLHTQGQAYIERQQLAPIMHNATHIAWATGGNMVPAQEFAQNYARGVKLL